MINEIMTCIIVNKTIILSSSNLLHLYYTIRTRKIQMKYRKKNKKIEDTHMPPIHNQTSLQSSTKLSFGRMKLIIAR